LEVKSGTQSNSSSSTDDLESGELNDEELMNEVSPMFDLHISMIRKLLLICLFQLPRFVGADSVKSMEYSATHRSISANDLFDFSDGDVDMPSRPSSCMSSRSARSGTAPPTTDFDTDDGSNDDGSNPGVKAKGLKQLKIQAKAGKDIIAKPRVCLF